MLATGRSADELPLFGEDVDKETALMSEKIRPSNGHCS